jgi:hypothetical protein
MDLNSKTLVEQQKQLEDILVRFDYAPMDAYEKNGGKTIVTRYEKFGMAITIERNQ